MLLPWLFRNSVIHLSNYVIFSLMKTFSLVSLFCLQLVIYQVLSNDNIAQPRIVGGYACDAQKNAPFAVAIFSRVMCGGALLNPHWILTAAHCLTGKNYDGFNVTARVGFNSPSDLIQVRKVDATHLHPDYDQDEQDEETDMRYDIGLARVKRKFDDSPVAKFAELPAVGDTSKCANALAVGVGLTKPDEVIPYHQRDLLYQRPLMCVELPLKLSVQDCKNAYKNAQIDETVFCASGSGKDTCLGDSGGALICEHKVIGIISYGPKDCGSPSGTAIYTKVESFLDFIKEKSSRLPAFEPRKEQIGNANDIKHSCRWKLILALVLVILY